MNSVMTLKLLKFQDRVNDLYAFKTHYHDNKTVALAQEKQTDIQNQLDKTIEFIKAHQGKRSSKVNEQKSI
jgi:hypothetical protein